MVTILVFLLLIGLLVFVHEAGHFFAARKNKVAVHEFGFGFPPRIVGITKDSGGRWRWVWGSREMTNTSTVYSINLIPLGGFVRIKGEDGEQSGEQDSFSSRPALVRVAILLAGVGMNFLLAWALISLALFIGAPQPVAEDSSAENPIIQVVEIIPGTPADQMGLMIGDQLVGCEGAVPECDESFSKIGDVQMAIRTFEGRPLRLKIIRGSNELLLEGTPRSDYPEDQGPLGIALARTAIVRFGIFESVWEGARTTVSLVFTILKALGSMIRDLVVGRDVALDVAGPVGIAFLTRQVTELGLVYLLQFAAVLSINLGIINAFPIPALDGGRVLFIIIEKLKGSPVSKVFERRLHITGFALLIALMVWITIRDLAKFEVFEKIGRLFS